MFWRVTGLATTSPVDIILDRDAFTLEELLDEDDLIQECKALSTRLLTFLRGKPQVLQLLRYVVEEPPPGADDLRCFKYPFVSCEVFSCEIDSVFNTLLGDEELMDLLFSFVEPDRPHGTLLAGYFSKVVICLLIRRTNEVMTYLQAHQDLLKKLVDLIGITSIMEVLVVLMRLVGADEQILSHRNSIQWLVDTDILEMIIDKLSPKHLADVHANAAEVLSAVARTPSVLSSQLAGPRLVGRLFHHVLEDTSCKSAMIHSLSVCVTLLDPERVAKAIEEAVSRGIHVPENIQRADPDAVEGMLLSLGDLLALLDISGDETVLPTTYGQLKPPLGIHRLKIVEFISVLLQTGSELVRAELLRLGAIEKVIQLFFHFPYNNLLHHQVEIIVATILDRGNAALIDNLMNDCELVSRVLATDAVPLAPDPRQEEAGQNQQAKRLPNRVGNIGHITKMCNKLVQVANTNSQVDAYLKQANEQWGEWYESVLKKRNQVEDILHWACGRPTALEEHQGESDEDEFGSRDFDIHVSNNRSDAPYRYDVFDPEDAEENEGLARYQRSIVEEFYDEDTAETVMQTLRIDEHDSSDEEDMASGSLSSSPHGHMRVEDSDSDDEENPSAVTAAAAADAGLAAVSGGSNNAPLDLFAVHEDSHHTNWCAFPDDDRSQPEVSASTVQSAEEEPMHRKRPVGLPTRDNEAAESNSNATGVTEISLSQYMKNRDRSSVAGDFDDVLVGDEMDTCAAGVGDAIVSSAPSESRTEAGRMPVETPGIGEATEDHGVINARGISKEAMDGKSPDMEFEASCKGVEGVQQKGTDGSLSPENSIENNPFGNDTVFGTSAFRAVQDPVDTMKHAVQKDTTEKEMEVKVMGSAAVGEAGNTSAQEPSTVVENVVDARYNDANFWRTSYLSSTLNDEEMGP